MSYDDIDGDSGCNYFTHSEDSRNFTFGGRPIEELLSTDEEDNDSDDGFVYYLDILFINLILF